MTNAAPLTPQAERLLLSRLAFGAGQQDLFWLRELGKDGWVNQQLAAPPGDEPEMVARLEGARLHIKYNAGEGYPAVDENRPLTTLHQDMAEVWLLSDNKRPLPGQERQRPRQEVAAATILRAIYSRWPLREVMVDFWHNHFNVNAAGEQTVAASLPAYDRTVRSHALGNFREFLEAVATSPAMLIYLNNRSSRTGNANENYGRELFELHTMGRDAYLNELYNRWRDVPGALKGQPAGYIDQDVYEAARAFTGWTIEDGAGIGGGQNLPNTGRFTYVEAWHDNYQKRVLATDFDPFQSPMADGRKVLDLVAFHPATARFICTKLCRRLVSDTPPETLVNHAAQVWTDNKHQPDQIKRVVQAITQAPEIVETPGSKVKRPLEVVASYVRGLGIDISVTEGLLNELDSSGQKLFGWAPPTGHPDTMDYWLSSHVLRKRWSLILGLTDNWWNTGSFSPSTRLSAPLTAASTAALWYQHLTGQEASLGIVDAILWSVQWAGDAVLPVNGGADQIHRHMLALSAMSPAFQLR